MSKYRTYQETSGKFSLTDLIDVIYPVGSIYMSTSSTNPSNYWGGQWEAWGKGRVPIGYGTGNDGTNSFTTGASDSTGGKYNSVATHSHTGSVTINTQTITNTHGHTITDPGHTHDIFCTDSGGYTAVDDAGGSISTVHKTSESKTGITINQATLDISHSHTGSVTISNSGISNGNMQPYIVCYMWKRTG